MSDPTYIKKEIEENPVWHLAWTLSEIMNENAPLGWSKYISDAECLINSEAWKTKGENHEKTTRSRSVRG